MKIAILKERREHELRVAASPDTVKKYKAMGFEVAVEKGAGVASSFTDAAYEAAGAAIAPDAKGALAGAGVVLKVQRPMSAEEGVDEFALLPKDAILFCVLNALTDAKTVAACAKAGISAFAMELMPRISRAQSMDVLSSQSNLTGYRAVLEAANEYKKAFPMLMTAAGTIAPAHVCVLGAGVAGLQAIATAKRLGAVVSAFDVRPAVKEQVQSLGATFIEVPVQEDGEAKGGYAKEMSDEYKKKQAELLAERVKKEDIVICTALIPGRKAPILVTEAMVKSMKPGSVIVDLASESGGNCELCQPGKVAEVNGVKIIGYYNFPSRIASDASALYAKNLLKFMEELYDKEKKEPVIKLENEVISGTLVTRAGAVVHPKLSGQQP